MSMHIKFQMNPWLVVFEKPWTQKEEEGEEQEEEEEEEEEYGIQEKQRCSRCNLEHQ